jgi:hypothetical protein
VPDLDGVFKNAVVEVGGGVIEWIEAMGKPRRKGDVVDDISGEEPARFCV